MLIVAHGVKHGIAGLLDGFELLISGLLVKNATSVELLRGVEIVLAESYLTLGVGARSEVTRPVLVLPIGIGEHIIVLGRPSDLLGLHSVDVVVDC